MRVTICDDSALFRAGLAGLLRAAGLDVIREAREAGELLGTLDRDGPDVAIVDIRMPPTFTDEGVQAALQIRRRHSAVGVLVLSTYSETAHALRLLEPGGGIGYLLKDRVDDVDSLVDALRRVAAQQPVVDPDLVLRLVQNRSRTSVIDTLTEKERAVLIQMAEGRSNAGVGQALHMSARTVEAHVAGVFTKLGLPPDSDDNRRVLAVLTWLRSVSDGG